MARALSKETLLSNPLFVAEGKKLYSKDINEVAERYSALTEGMEGKIRFFSASGRAEFIGNHTDHNHGFVIASAIDMDVVASVVPAENITIESMGYPPFTVSLDENNVEIAEYGTSRAIVKGVVQGFKNHRKNVGGFYAKMDSTVCKGAGVSSSASFELIICQILNSLYNNGEIDYKEMAIISQYAENVYFGKPSGLMDQLTASHGGVSFMDFADPQNPDVTSLDWAFEEVGLVIINCGGDHCDLTDEYADIKSDMQSIAKYFGKDFLREITFEEFLSKLPSLKKQFSGRAILRAMHFFEENERVKESFVALQQNDLNTFMKNIDESGVSSYELLQNCFPKSDVLQPIPLALAILKRCDKTLSCRVHGGGFAGTVLAFVLKKDFPKYLAYLKEFFGEDQVFGVSVRNEGAIEVHTEE